MNALTDSQRLAVEARGNVLVVAGAGTGKTSTLVHRCVSLLLEENCSLEQILMVTFTEAAAAQMRSRIRAELWRAQVSLTAGSAAALQAHKQLALLDTALICTLHSFCLQVSRAHFYELGIDPAVLVLDEGQTAPLISQTLDGLLAGYYADESPQGRAVQELIRQWGGGSDAGIRRRVVRLHRYTQALADPEAWLARQEALYGESQPRAWREWFVEGFNDWRLEWARELTVHCDIPAAGMFIETLEGLPARPTLEEAKGALREIGEANAKEENWPRGSKTNMGKALKKFLADVEFLASAVGANGTELQAEIAAPEEGRTPAAENDPLAEDWGWVRGHVSTLLKLTREFTAAFAKAKREQGGVDFSDLEQFALQLLQNEAIARQWREKLRFIFVDECQDINRAQDAIIRALSRHGAEANRFLVGDVKQSIYRFRLANPKIFCEYEADWRGPGGCGRRIALSDNFRSREALLGFVNGLFGALMRPSVGGVAYAEDAHLRFGSAEERRHLAAGGVANTLRPGEHGQRVELHLIDQNDREGEAAGGSEEQVEEQAALLDLPAIEREARLVGMRLRELREEKHLIWDEAEEEFRPVDWRDLVVLMRSPSDRVEAFAKEFNRLGIPLAAGRSGFFASIEISDLLSLLKLIDNPLQDVPLLAVLHSPLAGLSLDELAAVRAHSKERPFWLALNKFRVANLEAKKTARGKVTVFLRLFEGWRELARQSSLSHLLETVLTQTHYEALLLAEERGEERAANVRRLLELAREYDPYQRQGLYRFLRFVKAQEEAEVEMEPASAQTENAVRLMSIHKSKGLEFPVVALAGLGAQFNLQDLWQDFLLHETYGLCPKVKPPHVDQSYPSVPYWLARRDERRELLGEEMRLLYVALTRARDTLILTGTGKGAFSKERSAAGTGSATNTLSDTEILSARSYLDWLLMWLAGTTSTADWSSEREGETALLRWKIYAANDPQLLAQNRAADPGEAAEASEELDEAALFKLEERICWRYPWPAATVEPAVKRVSTLIWEQAERLEEGQLLFDYQRADARHHVGRGGKRPASKLSAAEIGSAHHRFLEMAPLERVSRLEDLKGCVAQMLTERALTEEEAQALDLKALLGFWGSEVGRQILGQNENVHREIPFTARFSAEDFATLNLCPNAADLAGEYFVVRGKADLAVLLPKEIWLLDFKTDQITAAEAEERIRQYAPQLKLYALGLGRIYRRPVTQRWLHFLALGQTARV